jgi:hypothetical protein
MNDDLVVQKILKLLENNKAFVGYAINGGIGTKINVRNTETGKTIQALSINVDSTGEVLVVKDTEDGQYKAVNFKTAEKVSERIIQLRKTKPVDDKKKIDYTDSDIEVFYLFVKLIDTGSPVPTQLKSTWIRKGSSCTQFVGAYERCNYGSRETINGISYQGLPYKTYETLTDCLADDFGRDAKTPHGSSNEVGSNSGWKYYSTQMTGENEQDMLAAITSHDAKFNTSFKKLFGYGSILECSGAMFIDGWEAFQDSQTGELSTLCHFEYFPGYSVDCTPAMQAAGYCDYRGFISNKCPLRGQELPGQPSVGNVDNSWSYQYGWKDLPYEFMYKRRFFQPYLNGRIAPGSFLILEVNEDQNPTIPEGLFRWFPGCPSGGQGGPYDGSGGNRNPEPPVIKKRDMKLSTHKAEIWLGSNKKEEAIKLYELGMSDLFSGMYNSLIMKADETRVDSYIRANLQSNITLDDQLQHEKFYENWNKNRLDLLLDPKVWIYVVDNKPFAVPLPFEDVGVFTNVALSNAKNTTIQNAVRHLYNRTINLSVVNNQTQVIHLKLGLKPANILSNTDCKSRNVSFSEPAAANDFYCGQSWEYQKLITINVKNWGIESSTNSLDLTDIADFWNKDYISRKFLTSFGPRNLNSNNTFAPIVKRNISSSLLLRPASNIDISNVTEGNNYEQWNYSVTKQGYASVQDKQNLRFYVDYIRITPGIDFNDRDRKLGLGTFSWWNIWNHTLYSKKDKRLNSVVGYEKNYYQILTSVGLPPGLDYSSQTLGNLNTESYFVFEPNRPLKYLPSTIKIARSNIITTDTIYDHLKTRKSILDTTYLNFFFSEWVNLWTNPHLNYVSQYLPFIPLENNYHNNYNNIGILTATSLHSQVDTGRSNDESGRFNTREWFNNLWVQFIYDGEIKVDIDSYKKVEFKLPSPLSKNIKYTLYPQSMNSEYNFAEATNETTHLETVLSPGVLDITKQVPIKKPTNVDLDPNMSFLLYMYPFCSVTKKTKVI